MKILLSLLAISFLFESHAAPVKDSSDIFIVQQLQHKAVKLETEKAVFWFDAIHDIAKAKKFAEKVTEGIKAIETFTGQRFDESYYGSQKIEYFISHYTTISHVYDGYHRNAGKSMPYVFFSTKRFEKSALPYLHETTHLILRDFHSLWIREGMAEWVAKQVARQLGKGHVPFYDREESHDAHHITADILQQNGEGFVQSLVGTNGIPEFKNSEIRRLFYIASTSFVDYLSCFITKGRLLQLYFADDTKEALEKMMGKSMETLKNEWIAAIRVI
jgi:hypothetical protein